MSFIPRLFDIIELLCYRSVDLLRDKVYIKVDKRMMIYVFMLSKVE